MKGNNMAKAERKVFGKLQNTYDPPDLIEIQTKSYNDFLQADVPPAKRENKGLRYRIFGAIQRGEVDGFRMMGKMQGMKQYIEE